MSWIWRCIFCLQYFKRTFNFLTCSQAGFHHLVSYSELPKSIEKPDESWICSETAKPPKHPVLVSTGDPDQRTPPQISIRLVPAILISSGGLRKPNKKTKEENILVNGTWKPRVYSLRSLEAAPVQAFDFSAVGFDDNHFNPSLYSVSCERELTATSFIDMKSYHSDIITSNFLRLWLFVPALQMFVSLPLLNTQSVLQTKIWSFNQSSVVVSKEGYAPRLSS